MKVLEGINMFEGRKTFYEEWVEQEGLEIIRGFHIDDMVKLGLRWWDRTFASSRPMAR